MPNIPQQETIVQYVTSSSQFNYTFAFYAPLPTDIEVYYQAANATPIPSADLLVYNVDYTVTYNSDPISGGYITLLFTPTSGYYLTINRNVAASLNTSFSNAQNFSGANLDAALDRLLLLCQQNQNYALERNLSYVINTYLPNATPFTQLPPLAQNQFWAGSGSGIVAATIATVPSASVLQSMLANASPGTDGGRLVGYYDIITDTSTTVTAFLNNLPSFIFENNYSADTGAANAYVATPDPAWTAYAAGRNIFVKIANTNTSQSCTLNISGLGTKNIKMTNGNSILPGDLVAGMIAEFEYDGTNMQLLNPVLNRNVPSISAAVYCSIAQLWTGTSPVLVLFDTAEFDPFGMFNSGSNAFVAPFAGKYRLSVTLAFNLPTGPSSGKNFSVISILKNGTVIKRLSAESVVPFVECLSGDIIVNASANDAFTVNILKNDSNNGSYASDGLGATPQQCSSFSIEFMGT